MMEGNQKWVFIGVAAVVVYFLFFRSSGSGAQVIPGPDTSQTDAARFNFASQGLGALASLADKITGYNAERDIAQANAAATMNVEALRDSALTAQAQANANANTAQARSRENTSIWDTAIMAGAGLLGQWFNAGRNTPAAAPSEGPRNPYTGPGAFASAVPLAGFTNRFGTTF